MVSLNAFEYQLPASGDRAIVAACWHCKDINTPTSLKWNYSLIYHKRRGRPAAAQPRSARKTAACIPAASAERPRCRLRASHRTSSWTETTSIDPGRAREMTRTGSSRARTRLSQHNPGTPAKQNPGKIQRSTTASYEKCMSRDRIALLCRRVNSVSVKADFSCLSDWLSFGFSLVAIAGSPA